MDSWLYCHIVSIVRIVKQTLASNRKQGLYRLVSILCRIQAFTFHFEVERKLERMSKLSLTATVILFAGVEAFCPLESSRATSFLNMAPPDGLAGSFFHEVPDDGEGNNSEEPRDLNDEVTELLRQRRKPPLASKPSTINGVPTAKATGKSPLLLTVSRCHIAIVLNGDYFLKDLGNHPKGSLLPNRLLVLDPQIPS